MFFRFFNHFCACLTLKFAKKLIWPTKKSTKNPTFHTDIKTLIKCKKCHMKKFSG